MTTLHPAAVHVLRMPGWRLRVWLALVITLALVGLPLPIAGLTLWVSALPYMMMTETLARMVGEQRRAQRRLKEDHEGRAVLLAVRDARITVLEADLAQARSAPTDRPESAEQSLYRKVGLHPGAPEFLLPAARRAFRMALHPDKHSRHAQQAHERYLRAQSVFDEIERSRA